jgi:hypothetical protein
MRRLELTELPHLVNARTAVSGPCVSIYLPGRFARDSALAGRLVMRTRALLAHHYPAISAAFVDGIEQFARLAATGGEAETGVALFKSERVEGFVPLVEPTTELAVVAESFHVRPLLPLIQAPSGVARPMTKRDWGDALQAYDQARPLGLGTDSLSQICHAAAQGRVKSLFLEKSVHLWGRVCRASGAVRLEADPRYAAVDDILDDLAEMTIAAKGKVYVIPTRDMPTATAVCATLRPQRRAA